MPRNASGSSFFSWFFLIWIIFALLGAAISLGVIGFLGWAIYRLVTHLTGPNATAMLDTITPYLA